MAKFTGHTITSDSALGAAEIERSLRFNDDGEPILTRTPSRGNRKTWTYSCWVKKSSNGTYQGLLAVGTVDGSEDFFGFENSNRLYFRHNVGDDVKSSALFRDITGWYHIVVVADSTQSQSSSTASDSRIRFYVNGEQITDFVTDDDDMPSQYFDFRINNNALHYIGEYPRISSHLDGYLAEVNFVDGSALDASYFGFTDSQTGIWMPKRFTPPNRPNNGVTWSSTTQFDANVFNGNFSSNFLAQVSNGYYTATTSPFTIKQSLGVITGDGYHWGARFNGSTEVTTGNLSNTMGHDPDVRIVNFDLSGVTLPFDVTNLQLKAGTGSSGSTYIYGIVVDGVVLIDGDISNIGLNGFRLDFNDNSSTSALGKDISGNGNDHATSNFSVSAGEGNDSLVDTPTNNFCTLNNLFTNGNESLNHYNGNLGFQGDNNYGTSQATFPVTTGKWYWECEMSSQYVNIAGITRGTNCAENTYIGYDTNGNLFGFGYYYNDGTVKGTTDGLGTTSNNNLATSQTTAANGDILGIASDIANGYLIFYKNGTHIYTITGISSDFDWFPSFSSYGTSALWFTNWGQRPFSYTPPAGHKSLCSKNLPPTPPSVIRPKKHFDTLIWDGNSTQDTNITGLEFKPDMVWIKSRSHATYGGGLSYHHLIWDVLRGVGSNTIGASSRKELTVNENYQEGRGANYTDYYGHVSSFNKDGFQLDHVSGQPPFYTNQTGRTYVAWCWKAGGAAVTNTVGNISAQVSANDEAGFSIITYTGDGNTSGNVGTGLRSTQPLDWAIVKRRDDTSDWQVGHRASGQSSNFAYHTNLNDTSALSGSSPYHMGTQSYTNGDRLYLAEGGLTSSATYVAYVWQERPGYSKFGSYKGNGNSNGTRVYCGFRPAWLMTKRVNTSRNWILFDTKRNIDNPIQEFLEADQTTAEATLNDGIDILADGFKIVTSDTDVNGSDASGGDTYIYMAFAEQPGITSFDTFPNAR